MNGNFRRLKIASLLGMAGLVQLLLSCSVGPDYVKPPAPSAEA